MTWHEISLFASIFEVGQLSFASNSQYLCSKRYNSENAGISLEIVAFGVESGKWKIVYSMSLMFPASDFAFEQLFA